MTTAREIMNPDVVTVRDDMTVQELASFLVDNEISGAPVEDAEGRLVGVVSLTDVALASGSRSMEQDQSNPHYFVRGWEDRLEISELTNFQVEEGGRRVADIMTPQIYAVEEDNDVSHVASTMVEGHLHRLLVTRGERVVGIITTSDLLKLLV